MILEAHVGWSPLLGWCLRRFQRPVAVVSVVASGVMVIALLVLCLSVAPARADITPGYDPYTHTGGSHSGRTGDKECTPREDFINTVFWYRGSGSRNMQRWLSSALGYTNVYNGPLAPKFHVHFDNRSNWDWSMHGLPSWYLSLIHISEPTRLRRISYAVFCLKKKKHQISMKDVFSSGDSYKKLKITECQ